VIRLGIRVDETDGFCRVHVLAIGEKRRNQLLIGGEEIEL